MDGLSNIHTQYFVDDESDQNYFKHIIKFKFKIDFALNMSNFSIATQLMKKIVNFYKSRVLKNITSKH